MSESRFKRCWDLQTNEGGGGNAPSGAVDAGVHQVIVQSHRPNEAAANERFSPSTVSWKQSLAVIPAETYRNGGLGYLGPR